MLRLLQFNNRVALSLCNRRSKYYLVVLCWFFIVAFLVAALCFHRLASLYGVLGYFAISYALIIRETLIYSSRTADLGTIR
jgi:uncharacterized membrane protein YhaH (DUF805 family)